MASTTPVFSYAQAAKGQSAKQATTAEIPSPPAKPNIEISESTPGTDQTQEKGDIDKMTSSQELEEVPRSTKPNGTSGSPNQVDASGDQVALDKSQSSEPAKSFTPPKDKESSSSSPSLTANVAHLTLKEDDVFGTPHESDATWEKVSQESQVDDAGHKLEGDEDDSKLSTWEEVPRPQLKEAPLPTVNFWQKRAMDAQAKAKEHRPVSQSTPQEKTSANGDLQKPDTKRKIDKSSTHGKDAKYSGFEGQAQQKAAKSPDNLKSKGSIVPPPPPTDVTSWPTPNLAKEEDKKKFQDRFERVEKEKTPGRGQKDVKWEKVDYVPTAVFSTPLPPRGRGGRIGGRGGRDAGSRGGHVNGGERVSSGPTPNDQNSSTVQSNERKTGDTGPNKSGPFPRQRRSASAGPSSSGEQRRGVDGAQDRRDDTSFKHSNPSRAYENRRVSVSTQTENGLASGQQATSEAQKRNSTISTTISEQQATGDYASPSSSDRRFDSRPREYTKETNGWYPSRERGERSERVRGNWRGKGGHSHYGGHSMQGQNGQSFSQSHKTYNYGDQRHNSQPQPPFSNVRESRHSRTTSRSQSITNPPPYGRFPPNLPPNGPPQLPSLHTDVANMYAYQHGPPPIMSAVPYNPYMDNSQLQGMVQMQLDYYFSVNNLCKDMWLRKNMDTQGFVFLTVIQNFNRIRQLTNDYELIRYCCQQSPKIQLRTGSDGLDRIRRAEEWENWVLAKEDRDPSVQNDGPEDLYSPQLRPYPVYNSLDGANGPNLNSPLSPRGSSSLSGSRAEVPAINGSGPPGQVSDPAITQTPLSADVPEFQPSFQGFNSVYYSPFAGPAEQRDTFSDEAIDSLSIVVRRPKPKGEQNEASSNDSALQEVVNEDRNHVQDSKVILGIPDAIGISLPAAEEDRPIQDEDLKACKATESPRVSETTLVDEASLVPPVVYEGDGNQPPIAEEEESVSMESYPRFRLLALMERQEVPFGHCPRNMEILYQFWSHFLVKNFNMSMYEEFRRIARNDVDERGSIVGVTFLAAFYDHTIRDEELIISDRLLTDLRDLLQSEAMKPQKPTFQKVKATWKLGSFDMPNRFRLGKVLDNQIKAELDR